MSDYQINNMIIDDDFTGDEAVTTGFTYNGKEYSVTFHKSDLELLNMWVFEEETSLPANLSEAVIESIRDEVKKRI